MAPPAAAFGRLVAAYSRAVATSALVEIIPETPLPQSPTLWISWHENNLITLALHRRVTGRAAVASPLAWLVASLPLILLIVGLVLLQSRPPSSPDAHASAQAMHTRKAA